MAVTPAPGGGGPRDPAAFPRHDVVPIADTED
jgi:hypothetical protein